MTIKRPMDGSRTKPAIAAAFGKSSQGLSNFASFLGIAGSRDEGELSYLIAALRQGA